MNNYQQQVVNRQVIFHSNKEIQWISAMPGERIALRVKGEEVNGEYAIFDLIEEPMYGPPVHFHKGADEVFRIIEGNVHFYVDGKEFDAEPGDVIVVPRGTPHAFANFTDAPFRMSVMFTPAGEEGVFEDAVGMSMEELVEFVQNNYQTVIIEPPLQK